MIAAIILAAGESRRMGHPKALLDVIRRSRAEPILVVLGHERELIERQVSLAGARSVANDRYRDGMLSSIRAGIDALDQLPEAIEGALVLPVDHPDVSVEVIDRVIASFEATRAPIVLPVDGGHRGHPVLFSRAVFDELRRAPDTVGARRVVWDHQEDLLEVEVNDPGIRRDVDTPGDYRALRRERS